MAKDVQSAGTGIATDSATRTGQWTPDEWAAILWHARNARAPNPRALLGLTAAGSARRSAQWLRELALRSEIEGERHG